MLDAGCWGAAEAGRSTGIAMPYSPPLRGAAFRIAGLYPAKAMLSSQQRRADLIGKALAIAADP